MAYITKTDVRNEGVTAEMASDALLDARIAELEPLFDFYARTWFEARTKTYVLNGYGGTKIVLPQPIVTLTGVVVDGVAIDDYSTPAAGATNLVRPFGWPVGDALIEVSGTFGNVDGAGHVPGDVKGALVTWVLFALAPKTDLDALNDRRLVTASSMNVGGRTVGMQPVRAPWSGHPDVDRVIAKYRRPRAAIG